MRPRTPASILLLALLASACSLSSAAPAPAPPADPPAPAAEGFGPTRSPQAPESAQAPEPAREADAPPAKAPAPPEPAPEPSPAPPPPPAAAAVPPPEALDERSLLELWRTRTREGQPGPLAELSAARAFLLEGKPLRAHEVLKALDPALLPSEDARLTYRLTLAEASARLGDFERAHALIEEAERALRPLSPLLLSNPCFSSDPKRRVPVAEPAFRAGQTVTLCFDLERLQTPAAPAGAGARVGFDLTLLEPSGRVVWDFADWEKAGGLLEEKHHRPWQDHTYRLTFPLPPGVNLGAYVLKVEASDLSSQPARKASAALPLTIRAAR